MQKGNSSRRFVSLGVALVALVALTVSLGAGAATAGPGHAVTAKKKCKKKAKKGAVSAKKRKCKRKKAVTPPAATPPTGSSGPTTRASITWDSVDQVDLHTYDASGNTSGRAAEPLNTFSQGIPNAHSQDQSEPGGPEIFEDGDSPSTRTFSFYVCLRTWYSGLPVQVVANITDPGGAHRSIPVYLGGGLGDEKFVTVSPASGTAYPAPGGFCGLLY